MRSDAEICAEVRHWRSAAVHKFTNVEMCRITEELIFQEPYQVGAVLPLEILTPRVPFPPLMATLQL